MCGRANCSLHDLDKKRVREREREELGPIFSFKGMLPMTTSPPVW
jgi:hypothetical protein